MEKAIKIGLAILFFICLFDMPYGYYQLVRMIALIGFSILAFKSNERNDSIMVIVYIGLAITLQPIIKLPLGRTLWNIVDCVVGAWLLYNAFKQNED